jgi:bla regulator protein blaR1
LRRLTGADLKHRIAAIVDWRGVRRLRAWHRAMLAASAVAAIALPIVLGADRPAFEVASVKRYVEGPEGESERKIAVSPDGVIAHRQTLRDLIQWAYGATEKSGPDMMDREDYNIEAKAGASVRADQLRQMMQTLLVDRFNLSFHREMRTLKVDTLIVGPHGLKLKELQQPPRRGFHITINDGVAAFEMQCNMERVAEAVSMFTDRAVIDKTGLTGTYQITLRVPMDPDQLKLMTPGSPFAGFGPTPAIYAAVEQFGLKLESKKTPVEVFVVDHIERPPEN